MTAVDSVDQQILERVVTWACWATRNLPVDRNDEVSGTFRVDEAVAKRIRKQSVRGFPASIEAVDKAVAKIKLNYDELAYTVFSQYFLQWRSVSEIAIEQNTSEFNVTQHLLRVLGILAKTLPAFDEKTKAAELERRK
ncbi:MAG TPA: hypothetical protein PKH39_16345 [Woeseiaceae bacterium]|nr:hypothetical protein [Woeseiaceae bacterium]